MPIRAASAPVSWGIQESVEPPAGFAYARVLDEIAEAGYLGTELGPYGFLPTNPGQLRQELDKRGLLLCSAFLALNLGNPAAHQAGLEHVRRSATLISQAGAGLLILSDEVSPERSATAGRPREANRLSWNSSEWEIAAKALRDAVSLCGAMGLKVAFHHHVGTHVETPQEVERLLSLLSPQELGLCLDTGHCVFGGGDAVAILKRHAERIRCVHLKDVDGGRAAEARNARMDFNRAVRHGVFVPLGRGVAEIPEVITLLRRRDFDGWLVVEQDVLEGGRGATTPLANATAGRAFLRKLGI